ncbi:MAG: hypothetical protein LBP87_13840 [Planctomycetaceae bacterium]|jgi:hypothetical protein|nr:hypothetical protein [Planctomycetaceae bacterium]
MNSFIDTFFPRPNQTPLTTPPKKQTPQPESSNANQQVNSVSEDDIISLSPEVNELLAKKNDETIIDQNNAYAVLGRLLGLDGTTYHKTILLYAIDKSIAEESASLTKILNKMISDAGLGDVTKKLTFAENNEGQIIVEGNVNATKRKKLAEQINKTPQLAERIKNQKTKIDIATKLKQANSELSLDEIINNIRSDTDNKSQPLLAIKRGVLSAATEENKNFDNDIQYLRGMIGRFVKTYNESVAADEDSRITGFSVRLDAEGNVRVENVQTRGGDTKQSINATQFLNKESATLREQTKEIVSQILEEHDDKYGDVKEFKHEVLFDSNIFNEYRIESSEADQAILEKLHKMGSDLGLALGSYFGFAGNFELTFNSNGKLTLKTTMSTGTNYKIVQATLTELNRRLASDDPFNDEKFSKPLPEELENILEKLVEMKEQHEQIHNPKLKNFVLSISF